jgi:uncharacterized repeat protein (TIGR01451 family)
MNERSLRASDRLSRLRREIRGQAGRFRRAAVAVVAVTAITAGGLVCAAGSAAAATSDNGVTGRAGQSAVASAVSTASITRGKPVPTRANPSHRLTLGTRDRSGRKAGTARTTGTGRTAISASPQDTVLGLDLTMSSTTTAVTAVGQVIPYTYTVTNTGNMALANIVVNDFPTPPAGALTSGPDCQSLASPTGTCSAATLTTLLAGQSATFTGTYTVTQADIDNGSVEQMGYAGADYDDAPIGTQASSVLIPATQTPGLGEVMTLAAGSPDPITGPGQVLTYDFAVTNTGNVTLTGVGVNDTPSAPAVR